MVTVLCNAHNQVYEFMQPWLHSGSGITQETCITHSTILYRVTMTILLIDNILFTLICVLGCLILLVQSQSRPNWHISGYTRRSSKISQQNIRIIYNVEIYIKSLLKGIWFINIYCLQYKLNT